MEISKILSPLLLGTFVGTAACVPAQAQTNVADYYGFGVTGSSLYGFGTVNTRGLITSNLTASPSVYQANNLATDAARNRVIYSLDQIDGNTLQGIYAWDLTTGTRTNITNGQSLSTIGTTSGGGSFYNGKYYLWDDAGTGQGIVVMTFDANGMISGITKPWGNNSTPGDLGDIAIDSTGMMYALTFNNRLYRQDLNNPSSTLTLIGDYSSYTSNGQLFVDEQGRLITRQSNSGNWLILNPDTPGILGTITGPAAFSTYNDLAEGGLVGKVPEPAAPLLALGAGILTLRRWRR